VGRPWYSLGMARTFVALGSPDNAVPYLERAHRAFPEDREIRALLATIERSRGSDAEAARLLAGLRFDAAERGRMEELLADLLRRQGRIEKAPAALERAVALRPDDAALRGKLARSYLEARDFARAVPAYREALARSPSSAQLWSELGHACALSGDADAALAAYETALRYDPSLYDIQFNVGILLSRKGDTAGALARFREALRLKPDYGPAREALGSFGAAPPP
jgi:Flp pilus assembly protein TadD